jgi:tetratricopeptide (TPR) repeat protein
LREKLVDIFASLFEVLLLSTQEVRRGRLRAYFKRLFGSESPVQPAMDKLKSLTVGEERLVLAETYGGVSNLKDTTERVASMVTLVNENIQNLRLDHLGQIDHVQRDKLKAILEPSPFSEDFFSAFGKSRVPGTGDWILKDETLQAWVRGEKRYLWIGGSAGKRHTLCFGLFVLTLLLLGTGKSFLTARIISWATENLHNVAYFFFRENNPETKSVVQALRDIAYQLSENDASYAKELVNSLQSSDEIKTVASAFRRLLVQPRQDPDCGAPTYIFLDGIDEAYQEDARQLLFQLAPGDDWNPETSYPKIQVALVGRSYMSDSVASALDPQSTGDVFSTLQITTDRISVDVSAFIANGVTQSRILSGTSPAFKDQVIQTMEEQVDGLFILAKFMMAELNRKRHPRSILKSLETFPKEINGMLLRTIESLSSTISPEEAEDLNEMLRWVVCAEEALTLEQLEAALILQFGDPPFRLEETLRGQYACFFELEREDGLTTDDLIKDFERKQRVVKRDGSPMSRSSPDRRISLGEVISGGRALSPKGFDTRRRSSSSGGSSSPHSPTRSIDLLLPGSELEFRSKKSTTFVSFFHSTIREFFRNYASNLAASSINPSITFESAVARLHIVKTCLRIFLDKSWFNRHDLGQGKQAMKQYAAWYWQEHVAALDPAAVSPEDKRALGPQLYAMLNDESIINDWSIMYLKNGEGLEVLNDENIKGLLRWFADADVVAGLDGAAKEFASSLPNNPPSICTQIGRRYAKAWLDAEFQGYIPTIFCFDIVQSVALMEAGYTWSHSKGHWLEVSLDDRIAKAVEWAGYPETGFSQRRIGSTYLALGKHEKALKFYNKALELDDSRIFTYGRIAYCLAKDGRYGEALDLALECIPIEEEALAQGNWTGDALQRAKWRLYKDYFLAAQCYYHTLQIEEALQYYRKAIEGAAGVKLNRTELFESEIAYLEVLYNENLHDDMMKLAQEMSLQITKKTKGQSRLVELILSQYNKRLVLDWIPKAASKTNQSEFLLDALELSMGTAHDHRDPVVILYLRLAYGSACDYSHMIDDALAVFEQISLVEYRPRGSIITRQAHALSFQKLAGLYMLQLLHAGLQSSETKGWLDKLEEVRRQQDDHQNADTPANIRGSDINTAAIYLGLIYRLLGRNEQSFTLLQSLILESLGLLADSEPQNDVYALDNLLWLLTAAGDVSRAKSLAQSMRRVNPNASLTTPGESPVLQRREPKLPDIQLSDRNCAQCLKNMPPTDDFSICCYCLECFCMDCIEKVIKAPKNRTTDKRIDVICRSDHEWFIVPPLNRTLHTGEILGVAGEIQFFGDWSDDVRQEWTEEFAPTQEI